MKKSVLLIVIITILSKIVGFVRDIVLAYYYGTSAISDAFLIALTIPVVIFSFIGNGISTAYIPMYGKIEQDNSKDEADKYTSNLMNIIIVICTIIVLIGVIFTDEIIKVFASGFYGETLELTIRFTKITLVSIYFTGIIYLLTGLLQMENNFIIPALIGLPLNIIMIISIYISVKTNIIILAIGHVVATAFQLIILIPFVRRQGYKYKLILNFKDKHIISTIRIIIPIIIGVSVNQINVLIDRTIASQIAVGGISSLTYANRLNGFIVAVVVLSISTVLYPTIAKMAAKKDTKGFKKAISESIGSISILVIPATIGAMVFSKPIVELLFGRGAFNVAAINMTSQALFFYSIGMIGYSYREIIAKAFYSLHDSKTPVVNAVIMVMINIILNIILSRFFGIGGLALASSISNIVGMFLMFISLRKKIGTFGIKKIIISFLKTLVASLFMGMLAKLSFNYLTISLSQNFSLVFSIVIGAILYFIIIYFMKIEEVDFVIDTIRKRLKKG